MNGIIHTKHQRRFVLKLTLSLAVLLASVFTIDNLHTTTASAATPPDNCFVFNSSTGTITDYYDNEANNSANPACPRDVDIPGTIGGVAVTAIGDDAFRFSQLTSVTIPSSVISIGDDAFNFSRLTSVTIPSSVTSIGSSAFADSNQLTNVTIHNATATMQHDSFASSPIATMTIGANTYSVQSPTTEPACFAMIGSGVDDYYRNSPLIARDNGVLCGGDVAIPYGVTSIGWAAFRWDELTSVTIPSSVTTIGGSAFHDNQLTSVTIPSSVTTIGDRTFFRNQLTSVTIPSSVTAIGYRAFAWNQLTSVTIPSSVTAIGDDAFERNQLTSVTIPSSVTTIGGSAFHDNQLTSVTIHNATATMHHDSFGSNPISAMTIGTNTYSVQSPTTEPACFAMTGSTVTDYYRNSPLIARDNGVVCGSDVVIPGSVISIGDQAFQSNQLTSVTIPSSVTAIGWAAFDSNDLTNVTIPNGVTSIGSSAFSGNQLASVTIPDSVTSIGSSAFYVNWLTSVMIPDSVTSIGSYAFAYNYLSDLTLPDSLTAIKSGTFLYNSLTSVTIPNSVTSIDSRAFGVQSQWGNDLDIGTNGAPNFWSDDPAEVQAAYDSIWYVKLRTQDPTNPNGLLNGTLEEDWWWGTDANANGLNDSLGGHIINPASAQLHYVDSNGSQLRSSQTFTGQLSDGSQLDDYYVSAASISLPPLLAWGAPQPEVDAYYATIDSLLSDVYYHLGDSVTIAPPAISGFITPPTQTFILGSATSEETYTYTAPPPSHTGAPQLMSASWTNARPMLRGFFASAQTSRLSISFAGTSYVLGEDPELTATEDSWTLDLTSSPEGFTAGSYDVLIQATDSEGNVLSTETTASLTNDTATGMLADTGMSQTMLLAAAGLMVVLGGGVIWGLRGKRGLDR